MSSHDPCREPRGVSLQHQEDLLTRARDERAAFAGAWAGSLFARARAGGILAVLPLAAANACLLLLYARALPEAGISGLNVAVLLAIFLASGISSIAGFAFSAICGAFLFHLLQGPVRIVEIMIVCSIAIQALSVWTLRSAIEWRVLPAYLLGGVIGLPMGVWLLLHMSQRQFGQWMGVLLVVYGAYMLFRQPFRLRYEFGALGDAAAGLLGGVTGGLAGFPGALVTIWCGAKGWDKLRQRAVFQPFILIMQFAALITIHFMRPSTSAGLDLTTLAYVPAALLGTWCGLTLFSRLTDRQFAIAVNLLLIASGIGLTGRL